MADQDQRFKVLLQEFFAEFFQLFFPDWLARFDFTRVDWLDKEAFSDPPQGERPYLDLDDAVRAFSFVIERDLFDGRVYNVLTLNATVREIVDALRGFVPDVELSFVDSPIMNQLSYEVSSQRFRDRGFTFSGDIHRGIGGTISLLRAANHE